MRKFFSVIIFILGILIIPTLTLAQDECASAVDIPVFNYSTCGDMALETIDFAAATPSSTTPSPTCGSFSSTTNDLWYSYTVPAGVTEMAFHMFNSDVTPIPMISPDASSPAMAIYRGNCSALTLLDCFEGEGSLLSNAEIRWETIAGLVPGETIYMRVWDENNVAQQIFIAASVILDMPEDDCDTPIPMSEGGCNILSEGGDIDAPETCGWNTTDNTVFYTFTVESTDSQPYEITVEDGNCYQNGSTTENAEIQFAIYDWNGDCDGIGGSPASETPNNSTYHGCASGTGTVTFSETLPPGDYVLAMDGYSMLSGNSLCTYGIAAPFIPETDPELEVYLSTEDINCLQSGSATITVLSSCGSDPTVEWGPSGNTGLTESNLESGDYSVTVTDLDPACGDTVINFNIEDNSNFSVTVVSSGGVGSVTLTAEVEGANPNFVTYLWDDPAGSTTQSITVTDGGTYTCTASYGTCSDESSYTVDIGELTVSTTVTNPLCNGDSNGTIEISIGTGTADFHIDWGINSTTISSTSYIITGLSAGSYTITVTDANGFEDITSTTLVEPNVVVLSEVAHVDVDCNGNATGRIQVSATGGTAPYSYTLGSGASQTSGLFTELTPGTYTIEVVDANGCQDVFSTTIVEPASLVINEVTLSHVDVDCNGNATGELEVIATGGTAPYSYMLNSEAPQASGLFTELLAGTYTLNVIDAHGCTANLTITIVEPDELEIIGTTSPVECGVSPGSGTVTIEGGTMPYTYEWSNGETSQNATALPTGEITITVTDINNCQDSLVLFVANNGKVSCGSRILDSLLCYGDSTASVFANMSSGFSPIHFAWYNENDTLISESDTVYNLSAGIYTVAIADLYMCTDTLEIEITQPDSLYLDVELIRPSCSSVYDGQIIACAEGGTMPYSYLWSTGLLTPEITNICDGYYMLTVTDFNSCQKELEINLEEEAYCIIIHNTITPNGDGKNDVWIIENITEFPYSEIWIFNRNGRQVYHKQGYQNDWGGKYNDKDLPEGTYYYLVDPGTGGSTQKGHLTIIR